MRYLTAFFCALAISANAEVKSVPGLGGSPKANAAAIQRAIDAVAAAGGGRVSIPAGTWTTGTVYLKSRVELHLPDGARLVGSPDLDDYNPLDAFPQNYGSVSEGWSARHLILALGQTDVAITGSGAIDGNGKSFFGDKPEVFGDTWWRDGGINARDREHQGRPGQLVEFVECRGVRVEGVRIVDSPCWSCFFYGCDDVSVRGLGIDNPPRHLNTDGIDIDSCRRVSVRDCVISTGDDAIAIRCASARLKDPSRICEDVSVENCTLGSSADAIRIGVGTGTIRNVRISNVTINRAGTGFHVQSVFGKSSGVDISDIRLSGSRISGAARAFEIVGAEGMRPHDIVISNVTVEDSGLVERSLAAVEQADGVRFTDLNVMPCCLGAEAGANRRKIQRTVDGVADLGGGRVSLPVGEWQTGSIELKSGIELRLPKGCVLKGSLNRTDYNADDVFPENFHSKSEEWSGAHLIYGYKAKDVSITGEGTIDGSGSSFFGSCDEKDRIPWYRYGLKLHPLDRTWFRPGPMVAFFLSEGICLRGVTLRNTPCWTTHFRCCERVEISDVTFDNDRTIANSDGISVDCTRNVTVKNCRISTGDDAIAVRAACKRHAAERSCENLSFENCDIRSCCFGIRLGIGTGSIRNVSFADCRIHEAAYGIGFTPAWTDGKKNVDIADVSFDRCSVDEADQAVVAWMTKGESFVRNVRFADCSLGGNRPSSLCGTDAARIEDVRFSRCRLSHPVTANEYTTGLSYGDGASGADRVRTVECGILPMAVGRDRYWAENAALVHTNRSLTLSCPGGVCRLTCDWLPGSARWHGFDEVILRVTPAVEGGTATLALKDEASGRVRKFSRPWTEEMRFPVHADFGSFCTFSSLSFALPEGGGPRDFTIRGMDGVHCASAAEAFALEVETGDPVHVLKPGDTPAALIRNLADVSLPLGGRLKVRDFHGRGSDIPLKGKLAAGETRRIPINLQDRLGIWRIGAEFESCGSVATSSVSCAVLEPRKVTPQWPRDEFRFGVNCHLNHYSEGNRNLCARALVRIGAKLVRCDLFSPKDICPREGVYEWGRQETFLREMERVGISLHAIIYGCPKWACWKGSEAGHGHASTCPMRPGFFESYCRELAARYGKRIDYYEIGNEWDMVSAKRLPDDQAIAMQHEAMRGLRAGCADAVCLLNGWASGPLTSIEGRRSALHRAMIVDHADDYDVYAIHCHGLFKWYAPEIRETLAFFRGNGIRKPWYSDESALSSSNGNEDEAARTVWKKIVFAWSHGSVDYIWYNLRGSGFNPKDEEHGYGLFTGDFHPRAGAAAFSALAGLLGHLRFDELLEDGDERLVAKWTGLRAGRPVEVYVGWDLVSGAPKAVDLPTKARKAYAVDLMGNRTPVGLCAGKVRWTPSSEPGAVLCELD